MNIISILITLIVVGAALYIVGLLPISSTIKTIINVVAVVFIAIWALRALAPALHI